MDLNDDSVKESNAKVQYNTLHATRMSASSNEPEDNIT